MKSVCGRCYSWRLRSLHARGVWIEIGRSRTPGQVRGRHSPQGECGLKSGWDEKSASRKMSLPARGVWIEIAEALGPAPPERGHSPQGECGLKFRQPVRTIFTGGHSPQGGAGNGVLAWLLLPGHYLWDMPWAYFGKQRLKNAGICDMVWLVICRTGRCL